MLRLPIVLCLVAAACGGSSNPGPGPVAPLPADPKPAPAVAPAEPGPAKPAEPPAPAGPLEVKIAPMQVAVKLTSPGKGKRAPLRFTAKAGDKQKVELAMDIAAQTSGAEADNQLSHTIVLTGENEAKAIDKDGGAQYLLTINGTDAREVKGAKVPLEQFKTVLSALDGLTIGGNLAANGGAGEVTLRIEKPTAMSGNALELIRLILPAWPVLPTEAIGAGAKWQATSTTKLADKLDITQITDYELVAHKGSTWTIKGTTKVTGKDQDVDGGKISAINGTGTVEATITDGMLYPSSKTALETTFTASEKTASMQYKLKLAGEVAPKN